MAAKPGREPPQRPSRLNLANLAYDRIEELIVACSLKPGASLQIQTLQDATGVGRTPIHQAVRRLAADTLVTIRPRHGLRIAPISLARERTLLLLRRDMERFVLGLAAQRCSPAHRTEFLRAARILREGGGRMAIEDFNRLDRHIDYLLSAVSGEPFLEHTLRPLHTIFRRIGWIYHTCVRPDEGIGRTVGCHLDMLDAVAGGDADAAVAAADRLIAFVESMIDVMERGIDPALLDCNAGTAP